MAINLLYAIKILLIACLALSTNADEVKYDQYLNERFAFAISYPPAILVPQGEADNGDGQKFLSKDLKASMLVYGCNNAMGDSLKGRFQDEINGEKKDSPLRTVTYKVLKKSWFVISGTEGNMIFYTKVLYNKNEDQFLSFRITYPKSQCELYDPLVSVISKSLKNMEQALEMIQPNPKT